MRLVSIGIDWYRLVSIGDVPLDAGSTCNSHEGTVSWCHAKALTAAFQGELVQGYGLCYLLESFRDAINFSYRMLQVLHDVTVLELRTLKMSRFQRSF